jgi:Flp pilus assembly CpaF family ATPase
MAAVATTEAVTAEAGETVRLSVEKALAREQVNLTSEEGRERTARIIDAEIESFHALALNGQQAELSEQDRAALARSLRDDFIGLGTLAERMLSDPDAQEWMVNAPKRVFRDDGLRIERVPDVVFADDRQVRSFLDRLLEQVEGKRLDRITPRVELVYQMARGSQQQSHPSPPTATRSAQFDASVYRQALCTSLSSLSS